MRISAVIWLAVGAAHATLEQLETGGWTFRSAPIALAGARSLSKRPATVKKLTDPDNSQNFVAYDAGKKLLMIQMDSADCPEPPKTTILLLTAEELMSALKSGSICSGRRSPDYQKANMKSL